MRATTQNGRTTKTGKAYDVGHHDRTKEGAKNASHIDPTRTKNNKIFQCVKLPGEHPTLRSYEIDVYKTFYQKFLNSRNDRYVKNRHEERVWDMEQMYSSSRFCPEERILQLGDMNNHATPQQLYEVIMDYFKQFHEKYGANCTIIDISIHLDEATPHAHIRRIWHFKDRDGIIQPGQDKALKCLNYELPDPQKKSSRHNNRKVAFTHDDRELFQDIALAHGISLERKPLSYSREHMEKDEFIAMQVRNDVIQAQNELNDITARLAKAKAEHERYNALRGDFKNPDKFLAIDYVDKNNISLAQLKTLSLKEVHQPIERIDLDKALREFTR